MIDIRNDAGVSLLLTPGRPFTTEQRAGWMSDDDWPAAFSYPIQFPLCEQNDGFLSPAYRPGATNPSMSLPVTVTLGGVLYRQCTFDFRISSGAGDGFLRIDGGEIYERVKGLSLAQAIPDVIRLVPLLFLSDMMGDWAKAVPGTNPATFFPVRNDGFFEADAGQKVPGLVGQPYVNHWDGARFFTEANGKTGYPVVPFFYLNWVLERVLAGIGYRLGGAWPALAETKARVLINQTALELDPAKTEADFLFATISCAAADHLPDLTVGDLFKALRLRFGLLILFDSTTRTCIMHQFEQVVADPDALDLTPYVVGRWGIDAGAGTGLAISQQLDGADELWKVVGRSGALEAPEPRVDLLGPGRPEVARKTLTIPVAPLQQTYEDTPDKRGKWLIPTIRQRGNHRGHVYNLSDVSPTDEGKLRQATSLRLADFRGMQADSIGRFYPLATAETALDGRQQPISGATPLSISQELLGNLGGYYTVRDGSRPITLPLRLPVAIANRLTGEHPLRVDLDRCGLMRVLLTKLLLEAPGYDGCCLGSAEVLELPTGVSAPLAAAAPVWVELISLTQEYALSSEVRVNYVYVGNRTRLTVRCWADAAKTKPASVQGLVLTIRRKRTHGPAETDAPQTYEETLQTYPISGSTAVLERGWITKRYTPAIVQIAFPVGTSFPDYTTTWQLEIGPAYRVLPPKDELRPRGPGYVYDSSDLGPI